MKGPVLCFGELLLRLSPPGRRLLAQSQNLDLAVGGAEANVAVGLSSLGHETRMLSKISDNPLGRLIGAELRARGVDTAHVTAGEGRVGLYFLEQGQGLRASSITYDRAGSSFALATEDQFDFESALDGARLLHMSGITPALGPKSAQTALAAAHAAKAAGVPISFDGNYRGQLWAQWESDPRAILTQLVGMCSILFGNHRDISLLLGTSFSGEGVAERRRAAQAAFEAFPNLELIASTARDVVNADCHNISARIDRRDSVIQTEPLAVTGIVDRIGTGDAFAVGILDGWLNGRSDGLMARSGLALAALKHSLPGDMSLFTREDLDGFEGGGFDVRR